MSTAGETGQNNQSGRYSTKFKVKVQSTSSCAFCWFVLNIYPTLTGMPDQDADTFTAHLKKSHGLTGDISA